MINIKLKFWFLFLPLAVCLLNFYGCVTVPTEELGIPTYNINGVSYFSLTSLCDLKNIKWDYDTFTQAVTLKKGASQVNLSVGNSIVLVNGVPKDLGSAVDIYQGAVVVPYRFKTDILDVFIKPEYLERRAPASAISGIKKIIVDAGHGGRDPGAIGRMGLREKDVTLDIAKRLKLLLESDGFTVYLTRDCDRFVALEQRTSLANQRSADLFVSIHANANRVRSLSGFEVYYISDRVDDARRALVSAENADLKSEDTAGVAQTLDVKATLWDIVLNQNRSESIELARGICRSASNSLDVRVIGVKGAPFYVLKWTRMPAILVEVGFVSNSQEEKLLRNGFYRQQLAEVVAGGIRNYTQDYRLTLGSQR